MPQRHLYLLLGSLDDETVRTECLPLPMTSGELCDVLEVAVGAGGRICGAVVPVEADGLVDGFQVAAVAWGAARGRVRPLTDFVLAPGEDVEPVVAAVMNLMAGDEPGEPTKGPLQADSGKCL